MGDGDKAEVTVSDEACVADVLAVACTKLQKPLPRSTLSLGGDPLDGYMATKLADMDIETDAVLRLVQLCDGQVNEAAVQVVAQRAKPTPANSCMCLVM